MAASNDRDRADTARDLDRHDQEADAKTVLQKPATGQQGDATSTLRSTTR